MNAVFAAECTAIRALLAQATRDEVATRYEVGARVRKVKRDEAKYGEHAVERIANEVGMGATTLYRYSLVAEHWPPPELQALLAKTNRMGEPLSWGHLVALTRVRTGAARKKLAAECLAEGWTIRELTEQVVAQAGGARSAAPERGEESAESVRVALNEGIQSASRFGVQLGIFIEALEARLAAADGDEELVERVIEVFEDVGAKVDISLGRLRMATRSSGVRVRVPERAAAGERTGESGGAAGAGRVGRLEKRR